MHIKTEIRYYLPSSFNYYYWLAILMCMEALRRRFLLEYVFILRANQHRANIVESKIYTVHVSWLAHSM